MSYHIALDCETGGIGDDKSLLTVYFAFLKEGENPISHTKEYILVDELDLKIKPSDGVYKVTAESLEINGIDLKAHDKAAITENLAGTKLYNKLQDWYKQAGGNKLIPIGHNVAFDIRRVSNTLISKGSWENFVSYRVLDTCVISQFLRLAGKLPAGLSCSLTCLSQHFDIEMPGLAHEAKYDTLMTVRVLENLFRVL